MASATGAVTGRSAACHQADDSADGGGDGHPPRHRRRSGTTFAVLAGVTVAVWIVGLVRFRSWIATGDHAIFQLRLERLADGHVPLSGAFSRLGVHHPGPAREWVFGVGYWLSGGRTAALPATAIVLNGGFVAAAVVAAWRTGGRALAVAAAAGASILLWGLAADVHSSWNPYLPVVAGYAAVWGCAAVLQDARRWPLPVLAGAFLAQSHATGFLVGVTVGATALAAVALAWRRDQTTARRLLIVVAVTVAAWAGPLVDLVDGGPWNLWRLGDAGGEPRIGVARAVGHVARELLPWSAWLGETRRPSAPPTPPPTANALVVAVAVVALAAVVALRRARVERTLGLISLATIALSVVSYSQLRGAEHMYLFAPLAGALLVPATLMIGIALDPLSTRLRNAPFGVVVACLTLVPATAAIRGWTEYETIQASPFDRGLRGAVTPLVEPGRRYTVTSAGMIGVSAQGDVALYVEQAGGEARSADFSLDLPAPVDGSPVFLVAMTEALACAQTDLGPDAEVIVATSSDIGLPVGVFLLSGAQAAQLGAACALGP